MLFMPAFPTAAPPDPIAVGVDMPVWLGGPAMWVGWGVAEPALLR